MKIRHDLRTAVICIVAGQLHAAGVSPEAALKRATDFVEFCEGTPVVKADKAIQESKRPEPPFPEAKQQPPPFAPLPTQKYQPHGGRKGRY